MLVPLILTHLFICLYATEDDLSSRIMYGQIADITDFPYFAALENCAATIISDTWLLTVAHCVTDYYGYYERVQDIDHDYYPLGSVWVGGNNINTSQEYVYETIVVHPGYDSKDSQGDNDIALLKLTQPLKFSESVQAVALPQNYDEDEMYDTVLTVAGVDRNEYLTQYNNHLMKMDVSILTLHECLSHFTLAERIQIYFDRHEFQKKICTKRVTHYVHDLPGLCYGDSGSPLVHNNILVGLAISADDDCRRTSVSMFTKVARYTKWIRFITGISIESNTSYRETYSSTEDYNYLDAENAEDSYEDEEP